MTSLPKKREISSLILAVWFLILRPSLLLGHHEQCVRELVHGKGSVLVVVQDPPQLAWDSTRGEETPEGVCVDGGVADNVVGNGVQEIHKVVAGLLARIGEEGAPV